MLFSASLWVPKRVRKCLGRVLGQSSHSPPTVSFDHFFQQPVELNNLWEDIHSVEGKFSIALTRESDFVI